MRMIKGESISGYNDPRITFWGRILRRTKLDELPQLYNIIKGEMRFIGPRPEVPEYFNKKKFLYLTKVKPGLSDYGSIFTRNEDYLLKNITDNDPYNILLSIKIDLANYYSNKKGFFEDLKLVVLTIFSIIIPEFVINKIILPKIKKDLPELSNFINYNIKIQ